jgi:hypothetical protein
MLSETGLLRGLISGSGVVGRWGWKVGEELYLEGEVVSVCDGFGGRRI